MKVREPVERPLDVVAVELVLTASQAYVASTLVYLAVGIWGDRGIGFGPVAAILAALGIAVGAAWLFWLLGGTGWPLAAASVPVAMFAGVSLLLGTTSDGLIRLEPVPLLLLIAASVLGIIGGVFIDSPRRWRWDQRRRLRPGAKVPRISPTTKALVSRLPRGMPARSTATEPGWPAASAAAGADVDAEPSLDPSVVGLAAIDVRGADDDDPLSAVLARDDGVVGTPRPTSAGGLDTIARDAGDGPGGTAFDDDDEDEDDDQIDEDAEDEGDEPARPVRAPIPTRTTASAADDDGADIGGIELPHSLDPKPQRSPWAWAAPPEWTRDEDDEDHATGPRP